MGGFISAVEYYNEPVTYRVPDNCLKLAVVNRGKSQVFIDDAIPLEPGDSKIYGPHNGKHFSGAIKCAVTNVSNPYQNKTHISFEAEIEIVE